MLKKTCVFYISIILLIAAAGIFTDARRASKPSYYFWTSKGSIIKIKPKYGRQLMPDRPLSSKTTGKLLLFSNSPETLYDEKLPALIYRSEAKGRFRVLLHHQNKLGYDAYLNLIFTNSSDKAKTLHIGKSSNCKFDSAGNPAYSSETISSDPAIAGRNAFIKWLTEESPEEGTKSILPGERAVISFFFKNGCTLSSMTDFRIKDSDGKDASLSAEICASKTPKDMDGLDIASMKSIPDPVSMSGDSSRIRGMFDYTELEASFTYRMSEISYCEIGSAVDGIYSFSNPGEYRESLPSEELYSQKNSGNFGVCYEMNLKIINDLDTESNAVIMASAAGGRSLVILKDLSKENTSGYDNIYFPDTVLSSSYGMHDAWIFDIIKIEKGGKSEKKYIYTLPCGCNSPIRFYAIASPRLNDLIITSQK